MAAYYNEFDPFAAAWLRELIKGGHIADGTVDERSIEAVSGADLAGFTQCHFFAGIGGWSYALRLAGWDDTRPVWTGSCPCQPFSEVGERKGTADPRHLWPHLYRLISECRPPVVFGEQIAGPDGIKWLAGVRTDLEAQSYAVGCADLCAAGVQAPHRRQRLWWVADAASERWRGRGRTAAEPWHRAAPWNDSGLGDTPREQVGDAGLAWRQSDTVECHDGKVRRVEAGTFPLAYGSPARVGRLRGYGNAIVPQVAAEFVSAFLETNA